LIIFLIIEKQTFCYRLLTTIFLTHRPRKFEENRTIRHDDVGEKTIGPWLQLRENDNEMDMSGCECNRKSLQYCL